VKYTRGERTNQQGLYDAGMFIRLAQGNVDPSRLDEYLAVIRTALPTLREQPGFEHAYVGVNRATARSVIVATYDTEEHANIQPSPEALARLQAVGLQPEPITVFEVTDQI
jgi:hypothetical protein